MKQGKVWVPDELVSDVVRMFHDERGHFGVRRTVELIQQRYFVPRLTGVVG